MVVASYDADVPKSENLLSVKRGNRTAMPCHMWVAKREDLSYYSSATKKKLV